MTSIAPLRNMELLMPLRRCGLAMLRIIVAICLALDFASSANAQQEGSPAPKSMTLASGPLRVHPQNPRYFMDGTGKAILLTGSHTWENLVDYTYANGKSPPTFDWPAHIQFLESHHHNFLRLWTWENCINLDSRATTVFYNPLPYQRTGPGTAFDGKPKFDVTKFNPVYFERLRTRVQTAREHGIYVAVMLFQGFSVDSKGNISGNPVQGHVLNPRNNIQHIGGENAAELRSVNNEPALALQEAYVRKVIETVNDMDNVLYEIVNEDTGGPDNTEWQYHFINFIHDYEKSKPKQHPVGMTLQHPVRSEEVLYASPAEWISHDSRYGGSDGRKVIVNDTDHSYFWSFLKQDGVESQVAWAWINLTAGNNTLFMDPYLDPNHDVGRNSPSGSKPDPYWDPLRDAMGQTRRYAERVDLAAMIPHGELCSTQYCLANPGQEYLIFSPRGAEVWLDLVGVEGTFRTECMNPHDGKYTDGQPIAGGGKRTLKVPFAGDAVLSVVRER